MTKAKAADLQRVKINLHTPDAHVHLAQGKVRSGSVIDVTAEERAALGDNCHPSDDELHLVPHKLKPHEFGFGEEAAGDDE